MGNLPNLQGSSDAMDTQTSVRKKDINFLISLPSFFFPGTI